MNPSAPRYWRSLEEFRETPEMLKLLEREFPAAALAQVDEMKRRSFLKLMAACLSLAGLNGCTRQPLEKIVPYVKQPEEIVPGEPLYYATAMPQAGYGTGILVKSCEGRPVKADGNPLHPASLGGSSVWIQACLLDLYNPRRARSVSRNGQPASYAAFASGVHSLLEEQKAKQGAGLAILTGSVTSPTLSLQVAAVLEKFPQARWYQWESIHWDNAHEGARLAFGEPLATHYQIDRANVIVSFEADFLYTHPSRLSYTRQFTDNRRIIAGHSTMNRLYMAESSPSITGAMADHRIPLSSAKLDAALRYLAKEIGLHVEADPSILPEEARQWVLVAARDLIANRGQSIVMAGETLPPHLHALEQLINAELRNPEKTIRHTAPALAHPPDHLDSIKALAGRMEGHIDALLVIGGNPAYDAPADLHIAELLKQVPHVIHLSAEYNETSALAEWHIPQTHFLETWSDVRSFDGTAAIMQPLIAPLFGGRSEHEIIALLLQDSRSAYELVRDHWRKKKIWDDFEQGWAVAVHDGVVRGTALPEKTPILKPGFQLPPPQQRAAGAIEISFRPDPHLWDGRFASNPWLREAPRPLTKLAWDNAALISPALAESEGLKDGELVTLQIEGRSLTAPVFALPGQARDTITLHLGNGRGSDEHEPCGFNFYTARASNALNFTRGTLARTGRSYPLVSTQTHHRVHDAERQIYRSGTLRQFRADPQFVAKTSANPQPADTLYNPSEHDFPLKWGMLIDLTTCIGCNACVLACNIENNIPVVGKEQIAINREMLWLRIDTYFSGDPARPRFDHQPVPCMHCENAPCEYVCPVGATLHDHEGLNVQVYNRCIGTRYCSNNCPYKVRRFNFLRYADYDSELAALRNNPEVTVRWRGVMEKCTYCVQRISAARIQASRQNRPIADNEVKTACQEACPANAIVFGPMSQPDAIVSQRKSHPLNFAMLGQLNTRPRTTYAAKLTNPNPALES